MVVELSTLGAEKLFGILRGLENRSVERCEDLPTGLILIALSGLIPESARFLMSIGRTDATKAIMRRFGSVVITGGEAEGLRDLAPVDRVTPPVGRYLALTMALSIAALSWSFVNFGLLSWLPQEMVSRGLDVGATSRLLAMSALIAQPTLVAAALLYSGWSRLIMLSVIFGPWFDLMSQTKPTDHRG